MNIETHAWMLAREIRRQHQLEREILICRARIRTLSAEIDSMLGTADVPALPPGLCGNREDHKPHAVRDGSLAPFWCIADHSRRQPYASQARLARKVETLPQAPEPGQRLRLIDNRPYNERGGAASLAEANRERGRGQTFAFSPTFTRLQAESDTDVLPVVNSGDL